MGNDDGAASVSKPKLGDRVDEPLSIPRGTPEAVERARAKIIEALDAPVPEVAPEKA